ncbi:MAG TPA: EAL domain-containing protein [Gallionella sp.]|nr:EAL domain-containing protein [Gallionella sp.]
MKKALLSEILTASVKTVSPDSTISEVLKEMAALKISCVVAVDAGNKPLGIFTERDAVRLLAERRGLGDVRMNEVMSTPPFCSSANIDFREAYRLLQERGFRHLVVVDENGCLEGIVTEGDFLHHLDAGDLSEFKIAEKVMSRNIVTVDINDTLADAIGLMSRNRYSCVVVTRERAAFAILTERDVVKLASTIADVGNLPVSGVAHTPLITVAPHTTLPDAIRKMDSHQIRHLVVTDQGQLLGLLTRHDLVKTLQGGYVHFLHETIQIQRKELFKLGQQRSLFKLHDAALAAADNAIVIADRQAVIQWANPAFSQLTGYTLEESVGRTIRELVRSGEHGAQFYERLWNTILDGRVWRGEIINRRKDGTRYPEEMTITPVRLDGKEITHFIAVKQNIDTRKQTEAELGSLNERMSALIEAIPDAIFFKDGDGRWQLTNDAAKTLFQLHGIDWQGKTDMQLAELRPDCRQALDACMLNDELAWQAGGLTLFNENVSDERGEPRHFEVRKVPIFDRENRRTGLVIIGRDVTAAKQTEEQLREAAAVMRHTHEGVVITDTSPKILAVNDAYINITGYSAEEIIGKNPSVLSAGRESKEFYQAMWRDILEYGHWHGEVWNRRKSGEIYPQLLNISTVYDDHQAPVRYIGVFSDITHIKENQAQLEFMAHHDPLTQLPNRVLIETLLQQDLDQAHRHTLLSGVLFIDLDHFKPVNDSFGHLVGDELLQAVAKRIGARQREGDTLGRLGGDEFILLLSLLHDPQDAAVVASDLIAALSEPFQLSGGHEIFIGGSIGISLSPQDGESVSELMKNADAAMYLAKENGRNQFSFYTPELNADARNNLTLENALRRALQQSELTLHYQPKVDLRSGRIIGAEALARWQQPDGNWISPAQFIPIAEKSSLILDMGNWVIEQSCRQVRFWLDQGLDDICIAINISARQFRSGNLDQQLSRAFERHGIAARYLEIELTESMLMQEPKRAIDTMHKLKQLGLKISLDDFGTGYSSLGYLSRFPIDTLKIDQSFVRGVVTDPDDAEIASAIIGLAHRMKLRVVAEGVETPEQLAFLRSNHCDELQGYYFSKPLPADDFAALVRKGKTLTS